MKKADTPNAEALRLQQNAIKDVPLAKWGPYLSERQWGTIREDYSQNGDAWNYFPHDHSRSRAYLWGEDGLAGISDFFQNLCFAVSLWNYKDPILKERLFGLTNPEGNHGEDVKELYYYLDNVPSHYYMRYLYKYPQAAFPYTKLIEENNKRSKQEPEYEILDTGIFDNNKYFDVEVEYAKNNETDIFIKIRISNRGDEATTIAVLPTLWFYNRWQYGGLKQRPVISLIDDNSVKADHERLGTYYFYFEEASAFLFTENETNTERLFGKPNAFSRVKDSFHDAVIKNDLHLVTAQREGTKFSPLYQLNIEPGHSKEIHLRLSDQAIQIPFEAGFDDLFKQRRKEADEFYVSVINEDLSTELKNIQRQAYAGLLWNKQYYHYDLERWINNSDGITPVSQERLNGRNHSWKYLKNQDIIVMPDKWEYPWYAAWDTAFHCIPMAMIDPVYAKHQMILIMREWYMNPQGQLPAYEWNFSDVNPPVHAFCAMEIYRIEKERNGAGDISFLKKIFQKLILNFTWWTNREDINGNNVFEGGFLGLDNIGVFNRSNTPPGVILEQADGTSWMGMYALNMMDMALEIAVHDPSFEDSCTKFYEHFVLIAEALNGLGLWNQEDQFFYDMLLINGSTTMPLKVRSIVGITPLLAVSVLSKEKLQKLNDLKKRMAWLKNYRVHNNMYFPNEENEHQDMILLSLVHKEKLVKLLERLLDESEFLSPGGIRALSKYHGDHPYDANFGGTQFHVQYDPGDATSGLFGGNSNWRGPVWMPINYLIIKAIHKYYAFYGDSLVVNCPTGSGRLMTLKEVANFLTDKLIGIFLQNDNGERPLFGAYNDFYKREENKELILFHEYFHGDNSRGLGASHQTGWTALLACLIQEKNYNR
jgi:hypothetical protein